MAAKFLKLTQPDGQACWVNVLSIDRLTDAGSSVRQGMMPDNASKYGSVLWINGKDCYVREPPAVILGLITEQELGAQQ